MIGRRIVLGLVVAIALSGATATSQESAKPLPKPSAAEQKEIKRLSSQFTKATDEAGREQAFAAMLAVHPSAAAMVRPSIEQDPWTHFRDRHPAAVNYGWPYETW